MSNAQKSSTRGGARSWANAIMALFFAYATYVQQNDPDAWFWMPFYGSASAACIVCAVWPRLGRAVFAALAAVAGASLVQQRVAVGHLEFDPKTEPGREASGTLIALAWALQNLLVSTSSALATYSVVGLALALVTSVYAIPKFYLSADDTVDHCIGLGFPAGHA